MASVSATPSAKRGGRRFLRGCRTALAWLGQLLLIAWTTLAIYYSNLPWPHARLAMAVAFSVFGVVALWIMRGRRWRIAFTLVFLGILTWWILILPSHDRPWRAEVAALPRAEIDGDLVRIENYRNFLFRSRNDFDVRLEERVVDISHIVSVDLFISYWVPGPVGHTFLSFNLDDGSPPVCISIETRPEEGESFDPLASMFKQFELIYVIGDERDIVGVRASHRNEQVYLYRIRSSPEQARALFRIYLERINHLAEHPEWYHLLRNNCTINIIRYSRAVGGGHRRLALAHLLNGLIDRYVYHLGIVDTSLGFEELRRRSNITETAKAAADTDDFSVRIREGLPWPTDPTPAEGEGSPH